DGRRPERAGELASPPHALGRAEPREARHRPHRPLLSAPLRREDLARGEPPRLRRHGARGEDPLSRREQLRGVAGAEGARRRGALQPMCTLVKGEAEGELPPMAASEQLAGFPYSPLAAGLLPGKYHVDTRSTDSRLERSAMYADRYGAPEEQEGAARFVDFARTRGLSPIALAIAWVAAHPAVTAPLLGARSVEQLEVQLAALDVDMSRALYD